MKTLTHRVVSTFPYARVDEYTRNAAVRCSADGQEGYAGEAWMHNFHGFWVEEETWGASLCNIPREPDLQKT